MIRDFYRTTIRDNAELVLGGVAVYGTAFLLGLVISLFTGTIDASSVPFAATGHSSTASGMTLLDILGRNLLNVVLMSAGGLLLGTITFVLGIRNGFVHGIIVGTGIASSGDLALIAMLFLPHTIFELPAIWLAIAGGFAIPSEFVAFLREKTETAVSRDGIRTTGKLFVAAALLVVIGAVVEYYVTLRIAGSVT